MTNYTIGQIGPTSGTPTDYDSLVGLIGGALKEVPFYALEQALARTPIGRARRLMQGAYSNMTRGPVAYGGGGETRTAGGDNVASTINQSLSGGSTYPTVQAPSILPNDSRIKLLGVPAISKFGSYNYTPNWMVSVGAWTGRAWGQKFGTDTRYLEICLNSSDGNDSTTGSHYGYFNWNIRYTDMTTGQRRWLSATDFYPATATSAKYYEKVDFGNNNPKIIELFLGQNQGLVGYNIEPNRTIWAPAETSGPRMLMCSSSIGCGAGLHTFIENTLPRMVGELLGVDNPFNLSISGSGFTVTGSATPSGNTLVTRTDPNSAWITTAAIGEMDIVWLASVWNDKNTATATITANVTQAITNAIASQPNAIIVVSGDAVGNSTNSGNGVSTTVMAALKAGYDNYVAAQQAIVTEGVGGAHSYTWAQVYTAAANILRTFWVDFTSYTFGTGFATDPTSTSHSTGDGNMDWACSWQYSGGAYISNSPHYTETGYRYAGTRAGSDLIQQVKTRFAL